MKKGVFIYSNFDFSTKSAGVTRMMYYAQAIANENTEVYLLTCSSNSLSKDVMDEIHPNVFILKSNTITKNFIGTLKFIKNLYEFSKGIAPQRVYLFYPSPLLFLEVIALYYLGFLKRCKLYYELNEVRKYSSTFHPKITLKKPIYSIKKIVYKFAFSTLEYLLKYYNGLICISTAIETYGKKYNSNTIRIPILTNPNNTNIYSQNIYRSENCFNIGFSGSIQPFKENLINFFKVLSDLKSKGYSFNLNLCGNLKDEHKKLLFDKVAVKKNILNNINYYGNLDQLEMSTFLDQQELLIIPRGFTLQNNYGFSTKLSDYLDHGKPILLTDVSDNILYIKDGFNGFIVPPDDNKRMLDKLEEIIDNYDALIKNIKRNANESSKKYFYFKNYGEKLDEFLFST